MDKAKFKKPVTLKEPKPNNPMLGTNRVAAGLLAGVAAISAASYASQAGKSIDGIFSRMSMNVHQGAEMSDFDQPFGRNSFDEKSVLDGLNKAHIAKNKVQIITVGGESTPIEVAINHGAKDVAMVSTEIAAQVGGERDMQPGEIAVIPKDQLK